MLINIAERLVTSIKQATGCEAAIFDKSSIIIAATDKSRLGKLNEGSLLVIKSGKALEHREGYIEHMQNTRPGHCFPIFLGNEVVGAVGIEGEKTEVKKYAQLVQKLAEIMLKESMDQISLLKSVRAHSGLFEAIISFDDVEQDEHILINKGYELGIDLRLPHIAIVMDIQIRKDGSENIGEEVAKTIKCVFRNPNNVCASVVTDKFTVLYGVERRSKENIKQEITEKCNDIISELKGCGVDIVFGVGSIADHVKDLNRSLKSAWTMLDLGKKMKKEGAPKIYFIEEYFIETIMFSVEMKYMDWYISQHLTTLKTHQDALELMKTVKSWCESGFSYKKASESLYIHRNTLIYRLDKIANISGVNLENPKEALALYLAIIKSEANI